jgi:hypothetical protein
VGACQKFYKLPATTSGPLDRESPGALCRVGEQPAMRWDGCPNSTSSYSSSSAATLHAVKRTELEVVRLLEELAGAQQALRP